MGVKGLETYITTKIPEVIYPVDIVELVRNEAQRVKYRPIIIIDFKGCIPKFYKTPSLIYGGRLKELSSRIELFVNNITNAGGEVVAFYAGFHPADKRKECVIRRQNKLKLIQRKFESNSVENDVIIEAEDVVAHSVLKKLKYCQLKCSLRDCDFEIMEYMKTNECLALVTGDTDFLMFHFKCNTIYISSQFLDVDSMTSKAFDQDTLRKYFNLRQTQMPLFGTLAGNDLVSKLICLKYFHRKVLRVSLNEEVFTAVANYVRNFPDDETIYEQLRRISNETRVRSHILKKSLQMYRCESNYFVPLGDIGEWSQIMRLAREKLVKGELPIGLYDLLVKRNYLPPLVAEDSKTVRVDLFLQPLRRRVYDILFLHHPFLNRVREDHITKDDVFPYVLLPRPLDYPGVSLLDLWTNENNRWGTFCNCIDTRIDVEVVTQIEKHLIIPSLALYYISNNESETTLFNKDEILSLIATIVQADESDLKLPDDYHFHIRIADVVAKFHQVCGTIYFINGACGAPIPLKYCSPAKYFDGDLFCYIAYNNPVAKIENTLSQKQLINYQQILKFITI